MSFIPHHLQICLYDFHNIYWLAELVCRCSKVPLKL
ncbi:hypothetical protein P879_01397 [Paragonimus westermani]|uniref:Uncharacterized protein n=1 Tax=Paragonimus westermani TaxID=34504 RepID=A0A8T0D3U0_9TREM|nr:hypothetical protein P879_01397 [Paragonimus westermani]